MYSILNCIYLFACLPLKTAMNIHPSQALSGEISLISRALSKSDQIIYT